MRSWLASLLLAAALLQTPAQAAPQIEVAMEAGIVELRVTQAPAAAALARLAEAAGFAVEGGEFLPDAPITAHLKGPVERVIGALTDPASHVARYAGDGSGRLTRLILLPASGAAPPRIAALPATAHELAPDDPAVGASRAGAAALRQQLGTNLGIALR